MRKLHLVGLTTERDGLIFTARKGSKSGGFIVPLDDDVLAAVTEARAGRNGVAVADADLVDVEAVPRRPRHQSALTPREMQARLRAGRSIDEVAAEAGVDNDWVARFAVPILAEQAQVVELARGLVYAKPRLGESSERLGTSVLQNLSDRGIYLPDDVADAGWSAFQLHDAVWMVRFRYRSRGRSQEAQWEVDVPAGRLVARNRHASDLGYIDAGRRRRLIVDEEPDEGEPPPPRRPVRPARPKPKTARRAPAKRALPKAAPAKAARPAARARAAGATARPASKSVAASKSSKAAPRRPAPAAKAAKTGRTAKSVKRPSAPAKASTRKAPSKASGPRRPAAAVAGPEPGPGARSGGVRSAVAQVSTARVSASLAVAERSPWAAVVRPRPGARPAATPNGTEGRTVPGPTAPPVPRLEQTPVAGAVPGVPPFEPRPLPADGDAAPANRVRRVSASTRTGRAQPGAAPVSLPAPRQLPSRQEPLPAERPKRRRLRSR